MGTDWILYFSDLDEQKQDLIEKEAYRFSPWCNVFHFDGKSSCIEIPRYRKSMGGNLNGFHMVWWLAQELSILPDWYGIEESMLN